MLPKPRRLFAMSCAVVVSLWLGGCREARAPENTSASAPSPVAASDSPKEKTAYRFEQLAQRLVNQSANIKEGRAGPHLGRRAGSGTPGKHRCPGTQRRRLSVGRNSAATGSTKRLFFDVPEKFDTQADKLGLKLAENFNAIIAVDSNFEEGVFAGADPKRQAARAKSGQPVAEAFVKHKVRQVQVGNGLYPTAWRAKRFGMTDDDLVKTSGRASTWTIRVSRQEPSK